ncbi:MAG: hypothetical protein LBD20_09445, partial [Spirochaetaceae bacterium]|nr:hypothetical protein [Spirochaetaceae bacterium]
MKNSAMKYNILYVTFFFAAFFACQQPETPVKPPNQGPGSSVTPDLAQLKLYDDTDKETPLVLSKSNINAAANSVYVNESAEAVFVVVQAQYPAETSIDISVGLTHNYPSGTEGNGIKLNGKSITIDITVKVKETEYSKTYKIGVINGSVPDIERDLITEPIGTKAVYWYGVTMPLNEDFSPMENAGYETIDAALAAINAGGSGTVEMPDIVMLGRDIEMQAISKLTTPGRHIKITVPPYRKYTISYGVNYVGTFFEVQGGDVSLTLSAYDLDNTTNKVDSMLVLDGNAVWSGTSASDPTNGANTGKKAQAPMLSVLSGGTLNIESWVVVQSHSVETGNNGTINVENGSFNMRGGRILKNKSLYGALLLKAGANVHISGGSFEYNSSSGASPGGGAISMFATGVTAATLPNLVVTGGAFIGNQVHMQNTAALGGGVINVQCGNVTIANPQTLAALNALDSSPPTYAEEPLPGHWMTEIPDTDFAGKELVIGYESFDSLSADALDAYMVKIAAAELILFKGNKSKVMGANGGGAIMLNSTAALTGTARIFDALFEDNTTMGSGGAILAKSKDGYVVKNAIFRKNAASSSAATDAVGGGGAIRNEAANRIGLIRLDNLLFLQNTANKGGAIAHLTPATDVDTGTKKIVIVNSVFKENVTLNKTP